MTDQFAGSEVNSPHDYTEQDVRVRGLRLRVRRRRGHGGPPLLLMHGLGGSLDSWGPLLENLPGRDVIMIDSPGMGRSELPRLPLGVHAIADRFAEALSELGVASVDVLGFSHGGTVAQEFAHRHRDRIRRLVLVDTIAGFPWVPPNLTVQRALFSTRRYRSRAAAERDLPILAGGRTARDAEMLRTILDDRESHPPSKRGYRYLQLGVLGWTSVPWLRTLKCPTLVIHGSDDPVVRPVNARFMASLIPNAHFELLSGAGHMVLFDEPERAGRILMRFLGTP